MEKLFCVYILANKKHGTLYVGVTSWLPKRVWLHKEKVIEGFTKKYGVALLVWYEVHETAESAIHREKRLKKYKREQKLKLIEAHNPEWQDLYETLA